MTEKEKNIRAVLVRRAKICEHCIAHAKNEADKAYYKGKIDGYMQAYSLIAEPLESINIEIER